MDSCGIAPIDDIVLPVSGRGDWEQDCRGAAGVREAGSRPAVPRLACPPRLTALLIAHHLQATAGSSHAAATQACFPMHASKLPRLPCPPLLPPPCHAPLQISALPPLPPPPPPPPASLRSSSRPPTPASTAAVPSPGTPSPASAWARAAPKEVSGSQGVSVSTGFLWLDKDRCKALERKGGWGGPNRGMACSAAQVLDRSRWLRDAL